MAGGITQAEYWNGEVGTRWASNQAVLDAMFVPLTEALFARAPLAPGKTVLDIGCGAGATTLEAARRVGPGGEPRAELPSRPRGRAGSPGARRGGRGGGPRAARGGRRRAPARRLLARPGGIGSAPLSRRGRFSAVASVTPSSRAARSDPASAAIPDVPLSWVTSLRA
ncbi:SAM-dependent methyltransferase [Methylobacterium oryzae]|uniref:SAM-dependent methyltransferase n=1 Tax=Methylobacterium oryzae TaxID=334852 RepID=UPI003AF4AA62